MFSLLKMRIRIEEEHFGQLCFDEKVWQIFHGIRSQTCNVIVLVRMQMSQSLDAIHYIVGHFNTNLHTQGVFIRKQFAQFYCKRFII